MEGGEVAMPPQKQTQYPPGFIPDTEYPPGFVPDAEEPKKPTGSAIGNIIRTIPASAALPGPLGPALASYLQNEVADIADNPAGALPTVGGQVGSYFGPVGAAVGGGGGQVLNNLIKARPWSEGVATEAAIQGATQAVPLVGKPLKRAGQTIYRKALAPVASDLAKMAESARMLPGQVADTLANTGIAHRIRVGRAGLMKADARSTQLGRQANEIIDASDATVDPVAIRDEAAQWLQSKYGPARQNLPEADMATVGRNLEEFSRNPTITKPFYAKTPDLRLPPDRWPVEQQGQVLAHSAPARDINRMRQGSQRNVREKYGRGLKDADTESQKALIHGESAAVKEAIPEVKPLFQEQHDLLNLEKSLARRITNSSNANLFKLYEVMGTLNAKPLTSALGTITRPWVQSSVGLGMHDLGRTVGAIDPRLVRAFLLAQMNGQTPE